MGKHDRLLERVFEPVDAATLGVFRIGFGILMFWETFRFWPRVQQEFLATKCPFRYDFFEWIPTFSEQGLNLVFTAMAISAALLAVGFLYRIAAFTFFFCYTYIFLIEQTLYNNHYYLTSLFAFFFCVVDADTEYSLTAVVSQQATRFIPRWQLLVFRVQLVIVYFYAGIAKINGDWLRGEPMRHMLHSRADNFLFPDLFHSEVVVYFFAYGGLLFDLAIGFLLLIPKTRIWGVSMLVFFHLSNNWMFSIGIFPWLGICSVIVFFDPSMPRRFLGRSTSPTQAPSLKLLSRPFRRLVLFGCSIYFLVQLLVPLRHFLYPGNPSWTEEGHNFAWHMKLRSKDGLFQFYMDTPSTRQRIDQSQFLTDNQQEEISGEPRLLRKFAEFLHSEAEQRGVKDFTIRVEAICSLNGRSYQFLIDPEVALATADGHPFRHASWIEPLKISETVGDYPTTFEERIERMRDVLKRRTADNAAWSN